MCATRGRITAFAALRLACGALRCAVASQLAVSRYASPVARSLTSRSRLAGRTGIPARGTARGNSPLAGCGPWLASRLHSRHTAVYKVSRSMVRLLRLGRLPPTLYCVGLGHGSRTWVRSVARMGGCRQPKVSQAPGVRPAARVRRAGDDASWGVPKSKITKLSDDIALRIAKSYTPSKWSLHRVPSAACLSNLPYVASTCNEPVPFKPSSLPDQASQARQCHLASRDRHHRRPCTPGARWARWRRLWWASAAGACCTAVWRLRR